jgi:hypothetical protein
MIREGRASISKAMSFGGSRPRTSLELQYYRYLQAEYGYIGQGLGSIKGNLGVARVSRFQGCGLKPRSEVLIAQSCE